MVRVRGRGRASRRGAAQRRRLGGTPGVGRVGDRDVVVGEHGVHDPPGGLDAVLAGEQEVLAGHGVAEEPLVGGHLVGLVVGEPELHGVTLERLPGGLGAGADPDLDLGAHPEPQVVRVAGQGLVLGEDALGGPVQPDEHLGARHRQLLAGPHDERDTLPAPRVDVELHRGVRLDVGLRVDAGLVAVALELAADQVGAAQRVDGEEHLLLRVAQRLDVRADRRLHGEERDGLHQVVLHDVAQRPDLLVEGAAALDAEVLGHGDLHPADVVAVPDRLEEGVREPEVQDVLDRLLAEVVVDAEDARLGEHRVQDPVQLLRRRQVPAEGLLDDDPPVRRDAGRAETLDDGREQARGDGEVAGGPLRVAERLLQRRERLWVLVVAVDVAQLIGQDLERGLVVDAAAGLVDAVTGPVLELLDRPR